METQSIERRTVNNVHVRLEDIRRLCRESEGRGLDERADPSVPTSTLRASLCELARLLCHDMLDLGMKKALQAD